MADFTVRDRRGQRVPLPNGPGGPPSGFERAAQALSTSGSGGPSPGFSAGGLPFGPPGTDAVSHARRQRPASTRMRRTAAGGTGSLQLATSRPRDPMWYWKQNNIPFDFTEPEELAKIREFCVTPDTPILMGDNTSRPIGQIAVGDVVAGWRYRVHVNGYLERDWKSSAVVAVGVKQAPVVKLTMASGNTVVCTEDHRWHNVAWTTVETAPRGAPYPHFTDREYLPATVGGELMGVANPRHEINARGYSYPSADIAMDKVLSIEAVLDEQGEPAVVQVVALQTGTGNYIAGGYASKNCRLLYVTHPIVSACIDVYAKLPMQGMEFDCKDPQLVDFYSDLFFDQLDYEDFLLDLGTEYWLSGESWGLGGWNDALGIWESDSLVNPDDVEVEANLFSPEPRYLMRLPESLRRILTSRTPHWQYTQLVDKWPELVNYATEDALMPVSNYILKQMRFKADRFSNRGIPILMRGFRTLVQEEMLNSALDSIADRLYTPLILTKIGATAQDLGTNVPWIPTTEELEDFNAVLDAALAADFRALTYHWAIDMQPVFGRENVPDLSNDFDRIVERILMVFGLSQTMLTGACLTGDTEIHLNRASKGYRVRIDRLCQRFTDPDSMPGRVWREDIPTYVARADGQLVRLGEMARVWQSGVKEVFELTTETGRSIKASAEHPFRTERGWLRLKELSIGDLVHVRAGGRTTGQTPSKRVQHWIETRYHPHQSNNTMRNGVMRHKVLRHRAVMEAHLNEMTLAQFAHILRTDEARSKELIFIPPTLHVHHRDRNHTNDALANLVILSAKEHQRLHAAEDSPQDHVLQKITTERVVSIEPRGEQMTYDIAMVDEPHNFLANDFVVHNSSGETYAADALNRDVVTQLLSHYQRMVSHYVRDRCAIVAEAQEHFDYEVRQGKRYLITEEIYEVDEESGEERIIEQPKLLIPELTFKTLNISDEEDERQFVETLAASGVPVPYRARLVTTGIDFDEAIESRSAEDVALAVAEQETRKKTFQALQRAGLPIDATLAADFSPKAIQPGAEPPLGVNGQDALISQLGLGGAHSLPALAPTQDDLDADTGVEDTNVPPADQQDPNAGYGPDGEGDYPGRPQESDEERDGMAKASSAHKNGRKNGHRKIAGYRLGHKFGIRAAAAEHYQEPDNSAEADPRDHRASGRFGPPKVVGMRAFLNLSGVPTRVARAAGAYADAEEDEDEGERT